jgi:hypothetical protein
MPHRNLVLACIALTLSLGSTVALAADSCGPWLKQTDGSYWQLCVADNGKRYCWLCPATHRSYADCSKVDAGKSRDCP